MRGFFLLIALLLLTVTACQPAAEDPDVPTLAVLPTLDEGADTPAATDDSAATAESTVAVTEVAAAVTEAATVRALPPTVTAAPTVTRTPTASPSPTFDFTREAARTLTAVVAETPRFATFTPNPDGSQASAGEQLADVVITEFQFQREIDLRSQDVDAIQSAVIDFIEDGIVVELTVQGEDALISGTVELAVATVANAAQISVSDVITNALIVPDEFEEAIANDLFPMIAEVLDGLLTERLGEDNDLEAIVVTEDVMELVLVVPR